MDELLTKIRNKAIALLATRDYAKSDLFQKLCKLGHKSTDVAQVLAALSQEGFCNETRYVENFIHYQQQKGYGPLRIAEDLKAKGIGRETIANLLQISDNAWFECAQKVYQKKFKGKRAKDFQEKSRQVRFLLYRGFTREQIENALECEVMTAET